MGWKATGAMLHGARQLTMQQPVAGLLHNAERF